MVIALDKINYARYIPVYYAQMSHLQETSAVLHDHFLNGGFSVQLRNEHPFARIAVDQTTEETINKDTQTVGGTRGFSLKPGAVSRYYLTAEHHAGALRQLRQEISVQGSVIKKHTDLGKTRIKRDESDVASMVYLLENNWTNPFGNDPSDLVSISTGTVASSAISTDLFAAREKEEHACKEFEQQRMQKGDCFQDPINKIKLKTFTAMKSKQAKGQPSRLSADRRLFGSMVLVARSRKLEMRDIGLYRDVWIAAIASSTTSLATRTAALCVRFQGRRVRRVYVTMQITFLTRKSALIYRRGLRQRVASLTLNCNGDFAIRAYPLSSSRTLGKF